MYVQVVDVTSLTTYMYPTHPRTRANDDTNDNTNDGHDQPPRDRRYRDGRRYKPLPVEPDDADQADEWAYGDENGSGNHGGGSHGRMESATEQLEFGVEMTDMNFSNSSNSSSSTAAVLSDQRVRRREQSHEQSRERSDSVGEEYEEQVTV